MVVLPFVVDDISYDLLLSFKHMKKEEKVLKPENRKKEAGSIEIGKTKYSFPVEDSYYNNFPKELTSMIRKQAAYENVEEIKITSYNYPNTDFYDVYTIPVPPVMENAAIDYLYGSLVNDLRYQKNGQNKPKVISLMDCGMLSLMNRDIAKKIGELKENSFNKEHFFSLLKKENLGLTLSFVEFFNTLKIEAIEDSIRNYKDLETIASSFEISNIKIKNSLVHYMKQCEENASCFLLLSSVKENILDEPLYLPMFTKENNVPKVYYKDVM